jgi:hypothetical protein
METLGSLEALRVFDACGVRIEIEPARRSAMEARMVRAWNDGGSWHLGRCKICAGSFIAEPVRLWECEIPVTVCDACAAMVTEHYRCDRERDQIVTQNPWWDEHCPPNYRELITGKRWPDHCDRKAIERVQAWTSDEKKGLVLLGASGAGKTLSLWAKARDLERDGIKPVFLSAVEFARKLAVAARDLDKADWLMRARVLIIDDLGKEKLSAAVAPLIWEVLDARNNHRLPTLISTRFKGGEFVARFTEAVLGEDIRGRIVESCSVVQFGIDKKTEATR